jgi:hypothetical protein
MEPAPLRLLELEAPALGDHDVARAVDGDRDGCRDSIAERTD